MLMNAPPSGLGTSPLASPTSINRQMIQPQTVPGLQSKPILSRGLTGLSNMSPTMGMGQGNQMGGMGGVNPMGGMGGTTGANPMSVNNPALMQLLGH